MVWCNNKELENYFVKHVGKKYLIEHYILIAAKWQDNLFFLFLYSIVQ